MDRTNRPAPHASPVRGHTISRATGFRAWWALFRVQVLVTLPFLPRAVASRDKERVDGEEWARFFLSILGFIPVLAIFGWIARGVYTDLRLAGRGEALLSVFFLMAVAVGVTMGVGSLQSSVYAGRDLPRLASLPVPARGVVAAKLAAAAVHQWLVLLLLTPPLVVYGLNEYGFKDPAGWLFWVKALLVYLLLPFPGLAVAAVLSRVLTPVVGTARGRDGLVALAGLLMVAVLTAGVKDTLGVPMPRRPGTPDPLALAAISLAGFVTDHAPPVGWAVRALTPGAPAGGAADLARFGLIAVAGWILAVRLARGIFQAGLLAIPGPSRSLHLPPERLQPALSPARSPFRTLVWREATLWFRTPAFVTYSLAPGIIIPVILLGPGRSASIFEPALDPSPTGLVTRALGWSVLTAITMCVLATHGLTGLGAVSWEGRAFWISRAIPASPRLQMAAKLAFKAGVALVASAPAGIVAGLQAGWNVAGWIAWLLGTGLAVTAASATGLALELEDPHLAWANPEEAYGYRFRPVLVLLTVLAGLGGMWLAAWMAGEFGPAALLGGALGYLLVAAGLTTAGVLGVAERGYARIIPPER